MDKLVTHTQVAPGQVKKLSVALLVDKSVPPAQFAALKQAVAGAAGITPARGDQLTAQQVVFAKPVAPKATGGPVPPAVVGPAKLVGLGLAVLVFLFFVRRHLRRREEEELAEPVWLREISAQRTLAELESAYTGNGGGNGQPAGQPESPRRRVEQIVTREPAAVANQVRIWMQE